MYRRPFYEGGGTGSGPGSDSGGSAVGGGGGGGGFGSGNVTGGGGTVGVGGYGGKPGEGAGGGIPGGGYAVGDNCIVLPYGSKAPAGYEFRGQVFSGGAQGDRPGNKFCPIAGPAPEPPALGYNPIYKDGPAVFEPDVKTGIIADQYAKLLDVPYREAFMPGGPESSIFSAKNVMPVETKADPRPYSKTNQIPIRDLINLPMRDATDAELLAVSGSPDEPMMSKDKYKTMSYELDYIQGTNPTNPGGSIFGITPRPPGKPISIMPIVGGTPGGTFTPSPGGGGGGTYTGPGVNLPGPVVPLPGVGGPPVSIMPIVGGKPGTLSGEIPLPSPPDFYIDPFVRPLMDRDDTEIKPEFDPYNYNDGGRVDKMDGGMMIIEDGVANDGIGSILNKYKEIRSKL